MKGNTKIGSVIILRGIAALAVCVVHIGFMSGLHVNRFIDFIITNGAQGVAIFFVISGFILPYSLYKKKYTLRSFFSFLLRRSIRIDPPYWCTLALLFIIGGLPLSILKAGPVLLHIFYLVPFVNGASWYSDIFWTLAIEFQFYILLGLFFPVLNKIHINIAIVGLILVSAFCIFMRFTYRGIIISNFYDFVIGYIVFLGYINKINRGKTLIILTLFTIFVMAEVSYTTGIVPFFSALFIIFYKKNELPAYLSFIGEISYSLYLVHLSVSFFFLQHVHSFITNKTMLFTSCIAVSTLFAWGFYKLIERPSLALSKTFKM